MDQLTGTLITASQYEPIVITDVVRKTAREGWNMSESSSWFTGVMMVLEGAIIGIALSLMLSRQGQKRLQPVLSVLCGIAAACVMSIPALPMADWLREGAAFSLYGLVFMNKNR